MAKDPITVFIIDESKVIREFLGQIVDSDPDLKVAGFAENAEEAVLWLKDHTADVVTVDIFTPKSKDFERTRKILETKHIPIIIVSATYNVKKEKQTHQALEAGVSAILERPHMAKDSYSSTKSQDIIATIKKVAAAKVIHQHSVQKRQNQTQANAKEENFKERVDAVAIGASLGGPAALIAILSQLSPSFPVPLFVVQHIGEGFAQGFIKWLQESSKVPVSLAKDGEQACDGHCYIAPDSCQMEVRHGNVISLDYDSTDKLKPSVDRLFQSVAKVYGPHAIGVILTGMGRDGAKELLMMRKKGAFTIAQDEESCIVFGMPKEAIDIGAVRKVLPLDQIAGILELLVRKNRL